MTTSIKGKKRSNNQTLTHVEFKTEKEKYNCICLKKSGSKIVNKLLKWRILFKDILTFLGLIEIIEMLRL